MKLVDGFIEERYPLKHVVLREGEDTGKLFVVLEGILIAVNKASRLSDKDSASEETLVKEVDRYF
jgi:hypothetical protein